MLLKICHRLTVDLDNLKWARFLNKILSHNTHAWTYFEHRKVGTGIYGIGYRLGDIQVGQEVLA